MDNRRRRPENNVEGRDISKVERQDEREKRRSESKEEGGAIRDCRLLNHASHFTLFAPTCYIHIYIYVRLSGSGGGGAPVHADAGASEGRKRRQPVEKGERGNSTW